MAKVYGHARATARDCRLSELVAALIDGSTIWENLNTKQEELAGFFTTLSVHYMRQHWEEVGAVIGRAARLITEFYIY